MVQPNTAVGGVAGRPSPSRPTASVLVGDVVAERRWPPTRAERLILSLSAWSRHGLLLVADRPSTSALIDRAGLSRRHAAMACARTTSTPIDRHVAHSGHHRAHLRYQVQRQAATTDRPHGPWLVSFCRSSTRCTNGSDTAGVLTFPPAVPRVIAA